jgi:8-oxo-dGTP pyrophosphatase MutT (NUDIX family)
MYSPVELRERLSALLGMGADIALPPNTRLASVLVPVLAAGDRPRLVFTKRTHSLSRHAGEISFPGGMADPGEAAADAALRECEEELGLARGDVEVLGLLPPVHTRVTGFLIAPFVGFLWSDPRFTPNAAEIDQVLEFHLDELVAVGKEAEFEHEGQRFRTHVYELNGHVIWGATARILWSFIDLVEGSPAGREATP